MNEISKFLERRARGIARDKQLKNEKRSEDTIESVELSDSEFWKILEQFKKISNSSNKDPVIILEEIFEEYSSHQIKQFADRYQQLNS